MPTYVYECRACGQKLEVVQRATDDPLTTCTSCQGELRKLFFPSRVIFRGSGWYITDSKASATPKEEKTANETTIEKATSEHKTEPAMPAPAAKTPAAKD